MRLTESRNARSEQLLVMPTELLADWEWLPGELFISNKEVWGWEFISPRGKHHQSLPSGSLILSHAQGK